MAVLSTVQSEDTLRRGKGRGNPDLNGCHNLTAAAEGLDGITLGCICKYRKLKGTLETFIANRVAALLFHMEARKKKGEARLFEVYFKLYAFHRGGIQQFERYYHYNGVSIIKLSKLL